MNEMDITKTKLYQDFKKALGIKDEMRTTPNAYIVECCKIAEEYAQSKFKNNGGLANISISVGAEYQCVNCSSWTKESNWLGNCSQDCMRDWLLAHKQKNCKHDKEPVVDVKGHEVCPDCGKWGEDC